MMFFQFFIVSNLLMLKFFITFCEFLRHFYSSHATFITYQRGVYEISVILRTDDRPLFLEELQTAISP